MGSDATADDMLLAMLHQVIDEADPVPDEVVLAARAVFGLPSFGVSAAGMSTSGPDRV